MVAGLVGLVVATAYLLAWYQLVERSTCDTTGVLACAGPGILLIVVGVPLTYVILSLGLRAARAPMPWVAPLAVGAALLLLGGVSEVVEPPLWVWPVIVAFVCALWVIMTAPKTSPEDHPLR